MFAKTATAYRDEERKQKRPLAVPLNYSFLILNNYFLSYTIVAFTSPL